MFTIILTIVITLACVFLFIFSGFYILGGKDDPFLTFILFPFIMIWFGIMKFKRKRK